MTYRGGGRTEREGGRGGTEITEREEGEGGTREDGNYTLNRGGRSKHKQELGGVTVKWTQRLEVRQEYLNGNPGPRMGITANIYLTDSDEEVIVDYVKDREELCDKPN